MAPGFDVSCRPGLSVYRGRAWKAADAGQIPRSQEEREQLAKEWLLRMIERTPLPEVGELSVPWVVDEAPPLIAAILSALARPGGRDRAPSSRPTQLRRAETLAALRAGPQRAVADPARPRGAAAAADRGGAPRDPREGAGRRSPRAVGRLIDVFGSIQGEVTRSLVESRSGGAAHDPVTGLPGPGPARRVAAHPARRAAPLRPPFALALVDVDGLGRDQRGPRAPDRRPDADRGRRRPAAPAP